MTKSRSTTQPPWAAQSSGPLGSRPPARPDLPLIIARLIFALLVVVLLMRGPILNWALHQPLPSPAVAPSTPGTRQAKPPPISSFPERAAISAATVARRLYQPPLLWGLGGLVVLGLLVLGGELVVNLALLGLQRRAFARAGHARLRIRLPQPQGAARGSQTNGEDFFHAIHRLLPHYGSQNGSAPWLALTLSARPDEPVEVGAVFGGGTSQQRSSWVAAIRKIIAGLDPGALVDEQPDPLEHLEANAVVLWREYALFHPPSYPLRLPAETSSDLLAPIVAALRGRLGASYSEYQVIVRPRHDWDLTNGWRVYALRRLLQLRARHQYYLNPDMTALQDKIDNPAYDVTIRILAVARDATQEATARSELSEIGAILLGQYQARSGTRLQRLLQVRAGRVRVPEHASHPRRTLLLAAGLALLGGCITWVCFQLSGTGWSTWLQGRWQVLDEAPFGQRAIARGLPWAIIAAAALLGPWAVLRAHGVLARTQLRWLVNRPPRCTPLAAVLLPIRAWRAPSVLSANELSGLWHVPTAAMGSLIRWLPCRVLPAPPHAFLPEAPQVRPERRWFGRARPMPTLVAPSAADPRIVVGHALRSDGTFAPVGPALRDLRQIVHLTAGMGAGKSRLLANVCEQLIPHGFILADGKGDDHAGSLVATVRALVPRDAEARLVILDVLDTDWPIGINPLSGIDLGRPGGVDMALGQVLAIFGRLDPEIWAKSMGMQQYIRMGALLTLAGEPNPTMAHIKQALIDDGYRKKLLARCTNIEVRTFWEVTFPKTGEQQTVSLDALLRRFDNLLATETTRYLLTQPLSTFEFRRAMDDGLMVLVPMPDMTLGGMASLIGMLALQAIVRAAFQRSGSDQSRTTYPVIIDEFQVFLSAGATEDVSTAITRLRSLGIGGIYAHQSLTQLGDLKDVMLINAQSRIVLRTQEPDASVYGRQYAASGLTAIDIANQDPHEHQYAVLQCDGQLAGPLSMRPLRWPTPLDETTPSAPAARWQTVVAAQSTLADAVICSMVYGTYTAIHFQRIVVGLAALPDDAWMFLAERWRAISAAQRAYILANPGCIPDPLERQRWLSRLWAALPRVLVAAAYQRQRWMVTPGEMPARVAGQRRPVQIGSAGALRPKAESVTWGRSVGPAAAPVTGKSEEPQ